MKTKITILIMAVSLFTNVMAQEDNVLYNIYFGDEEWLDAFQEVLGTNPRTGTSPFTWVGEKIVGELKIDGNFIREETPFTSEDGKELKYAVRLRNTAVGTYIEFPEVDNAGKITVYVRSGNASNEDVLNLEKKDDGNWVNVHTWPVPGTDNLEGDCVEVSHDISINEPVTLRLYKVNGVFQKIYYILLEKYSDTSSIQSQVSEKIDLSVSGKSLFLSESISNGDLMIFDLVGKQVFSCKVNSNQIDLQNINTGIYIVKLITEQGEVIRKVIM